MCTCVLRNMCYIKCRAHNSLFNFSFFQIFEEHLYHTVQVLAQRSGRITDMPNFCILQNLKSPHMGSSTHLFFLHFTCNSRNAFAGTEKQNITETSQYLVVFLLYTLLVRRTLTIVRNLLLTHNSYAKNIRSTTFHWHAW